MSAIPSQIADATQELANTTLLLQDRNGSRRNGSKRGIIVADTPQPILTGTQNMVPQMNTPLINVSEQQPTLVVENVVPVEGAPTIPVETQEQLFRSSKLPLTRMKSVVEPAPSLVVPPVPARIASVVPTAVEVMPVQQIPTYELKTVENEKRTRPYTQQDKKTYYQFSGDKWYNVSCTTDKYEGEGISMIKMNCNAEEDDDLNEKMAKNAPILNVYLQWVGRKLCSQYQAKYHHKHKGDKKHLVEESIKEQRIYFLLGCALQNEVRRLKMERLKEGVEDVFPEHCLGKSFHAVCLMNKKYPRWKDGNKLPINETIKYYNSLLKDLTEIFNSNVLAGQFALAYCCGMDYAFTSSQFIALDKKMNNPEEFKKLLSHLRGHTQGHFLNPWIKKHDLDEKVSLMNPMILEEVLNKVLIIGDDPSREATADDQIWHKIKAQELPYVQIPSAVLNRK